MKGAIFLVRWLIVVLVMAGAALPALGQEATGRSPSRRLELKRPAEGSVKGAPPQLAIEALQFEEPSGNNVLDANEQGTIALTVANTGKGEARGLAVVLSNDSLAQGLSFSSRTNVQPIAPGARAELKVPVRATGEATDRRVTLSVHVAEANGFDSDPFALSFELRGFRPPRLVIYDTLQVDDGQEGLAYGNNNGRLELGETAQITVYVQNTGAGAADGVTLEVSGLPAENVYYQSEHKTFELGSLAPGEYKEVAFAITPNKRYQGNVIPVTLKARDRTGRFADEQTSSIALNQRLTNITHIEVARRDEPAASVAAVNVQVPPGSVDVDMRVPRTTMANPDAVAVVIGNRVYNREEVPAVEYALRGAETMKQYLVQGLGFRPENIIFEQNAGKSTFERIFGTSADWQGQLYNYIKPGTSDVFIYYQGHGAPDVEKRQGFLVPSDADPAYIRFTGYPLDLLYANLGKLPARSVTVVIDACFSGTTEKGMLLKNISPIMITVENPVLGSANMVVFSAAQADQTSSWYPEKKHGLFTYFFLKGLQGEADVDHNSRVTTGELEAYVKDNVPYVARRLNSREQLPQMMGTNRELVLIDFSK